MLEAVPARVVGRVAEPEVGAQVDDRGAGRGRSGLGDLRRRGAVRQRHEDRVEWAVSGSSAWTSRSSRGEVRVDADDRVVVAARARPGRRARHSGVAPAAGPARHRHSPVAPMIPTRNRRGPPAGSTPRSERGRKGRRGSSGSAGRRSSSNDYTGTLHSHATCAVTAPVPTTSARTTPIDRCMWAASHTALMQSTCITGGGSSAQDHPAIDRCMWAASHTALMQSTCITGGGSLARGARYPTTSLGLVWYRRPVVPPLPRL